MRTKRKNNYTGFSCKKIKTSRLKSVIVVPNYQPILYYDIYIMIIGFCPDKLNLRLVCKTWRDIVNKYTTNMVVAGNRGAKLFDIMPNLTKLKLLNSYDYRDYKKFKHIKTLKIINFTSDAVVFKFNKSVRKVKVQPREDRECLKWLFRGLNSHKSIYKLTISHKSDYCSTCALEYRNLTYIKILKLIKFDKFTGKLLKHISVSNVQTLILKNFRNKYMVLNDWDILNECGLQVILYKKDFHRDDIAYLQKIKNIIWR